MHFSQKYILYLCVCGEKNVLIPQHRNLLRNSTFNYEFCTTAIVYLSTRNKFQELSVMPSVLIEL